MVIWAHCERMYEETLELISEGLFSLSQICEVVVTLSKFYANDKKRSLEMADRLWTGILAKAHKGLDANSVIGLFRILPHLTQSRDLVYKEVSNQAQWAQIS